MRATANLWVVFSADEERSRESRLLNRAVELGREDHWDEALALCDQAIALDPEYSRAHAVRACALLWGHDDAVRAGSLFDLLWGSEELEAALAAADAAITLDDNNGAAWMARAQALAELQRFRPSIAACERAQQIFREKRLLDGLSYITELALDISSHLIDLGESKNPGYSGKGREARQWKPAEFPPEIMPDAAQDLNALAADLDLPFEVARKALQQAKAELTARETTSPAKEPPRPDDAMTERTSRKPRRVTANELNKVPPALRVKQHKKYEFAPEELANAERFRAERSISNARNHKLSKGVKLTENEDERGKMAASFVKQALRRNPRLVAG